MYVGVFKRFVALLLDLIIVIGLTLLLLFIIQLVLMLPKEDTLLSIVTSIFEHPSDFSKQKLGYLMAYYLLAAFIWLFYEFLFVCSRFSGTPGKIVLGIEIACYNNANLFKAFIRSFIKVLSIASVVGMIIESSVLSKSDNRQSLHDKASFTLVKKKELQGVVESKNIEMIFNDFEEGKLNSFEDIMDLKSRIADNKLSVKENQGLAASWLFIMLALLVSASLITCHFLGITIL